MPDYRNKIEYLRGKMVDHLAHKPPRRQRAKEVWMNLNYYVWLQLKSENKLQKNLHEKHQASRCRPNPILGASPPGEGGGGSPDARSAQ